MTHAKLGHGLLLAVLAIALAACASPSDDIAVAASASPMPTCAVAEMPGVDAPEGCITYDAEKNMASNETYRDRMPQPDAGRMTGEALIEQVTAALTELRNSGATLTEDAVGAALVNAGVIEKHIQMLGGARAIAFGAAVDGGGCVFGSITAETVTVDVGGFIMDGGCLAMIGH